MEAVKALRKDDGFAEVLGFDEATRVRQEDGTKDQLILALGALDSDGDKKNKLGGIPARGARR